MERALQPVEWLEQERALPFWSSAGKEDVSTLRDSLIDILPF